MKHRPPEKTPLPGLHVLKDHWTERSFLEDDCCALMRDGQLKSAVAATVESAPKRTQGFFPPRLKRAFIIPEDMSESSKERRLEAGLWAKYGQPSSLPVELLWDRLVFYQVPLFSARAKGSWGCVDLLGLKDGRPVVVELKIATSTDTPLHALLEASTYATVLRKNWKVVRQELNEYCVDRGLPVTMDDEPKNWQLVLLAPAAYWETCNKGVISSPSARQAYLQLCDGFAGPSELSMPICHAEVDERSLDVRLRDLPSRKW